MDQYLVPLWWLNYEFVDYEAIPANYVWKSPSDKDAKANMMALFEKAG